MSIKNKDDWIPATATHNYFNEPLLDWFKYAYKQEEKHSNNVKYHKEPETVKDYLCNQGIEFEKKIVELLYKKVDKNKIHKVESNFMAKDDDKAKETLQCMKKGYYIIVSGVLHDYKNKCYGIPDLLIRSDIINKIFTNTVLDIDEECVNAPLLGNNKWHYRVIDIKFMTLNLKCNGETLLNSRCIPSYKSQLYIYNKALGYTQGYEPGQSYLLGRRWIYQKNGVQYYNDCCFDKLGVIDYENDDIQYGDLTKKAIKWIKLCKTKKAQKWDIFTYPLERNELYPNMCNQFDGKWHDLKNTIAKNNHELTELWQVGKKNRDTGISNGVYNWKDKNCTSTNLGINGKKGEILDKIIKINQKNTILFEPIVIQNNCFNWKQLDKIEFFVDFEFRNAVFDNVIKLPIADKSCLLFTIGVGYMHPKKYKWVFKDFTVDHITESYECDICELFLKFVYKKSKKYHVKTPKCWHWSPAEPTMFNNVMNKHKLIKNLWKTKYFEWCDLLTVFQSEPIVINGCLNFKLKSIAKAMYNHGFISTIWDDNNIVNGQIAMIETVTADKIAMKKNVSMKTIPIVKSVIKYNEIDVKVLQEILAYIRRHQVQPIRNKRKLDLPAHNTRSKKRSCT